MLELLSLAKSWQFLQSHLLSMVTRLDITSMCMSTAYRGKQTQDWYNSLHKPAFTPPTWAFAPVWALLYASIATAGFMIFTNKKSSSIPILKIAFVVQIVANILWSPLFFDMRSIGLALLDLGLVWSANLYCITATYDKMRHVALILVPYQLWLTLAGIINTFIFLNN